MKAIHNFVPRFQIFKIVVLYPKDTEKWKQFTTDTVKRNKKPLLFCIPKILKNESNSQQLKSSDFSFLRCFVSQRYWKMKAIHNFRRYVQFNAKVVLYPKDTEKWKQFTTFCFKILLGMVLFCIPKILKNESNSQHIEHRFQNFKRCFVSQRYWKMKAIHNLLIVVYHKRSVVLYPKDTEKWKQFTTRIECQRKKILLFCIPKILKNESNSQRNSCLSKTTLGCFVSQRYWKMKAIHNHLTVVIVLVLVVLYPKDTEKWKQFTTRRFTYYI